MCMYKELTDRDWPYQRLQLPVLVLVHSHNGQNFQILSRNYAAGFAFKIIKNLSIKYFSFYLTNTTHDFIGALNQISHNMARVNLKKSEELVTNTTTAWKYTPKKPIICINCNPP